MHHSGLNPPPSWQCTVCCYCCCYCTSTAILGRPSPLTFGFKGVVIVYMSIHTCPRMPLEENLQNNQADSPFYMCLVFDLVICKNGRLQRVWPYAFTSLTAHLKFGLTSDLVICKFSKSMVIHDTKCPWDQMSLNNTDPNPIPHWLIDP